MKRTLWKTVEVVGYIAVGFCYVLVCTLPSIQIREYVLLGALIYELRILGDSRLTGYRRGY